MGLSKEQKYYRNWKGYLFGYAWKKGMDISNYEDEIIEDLFALGKTPSQAYKELLTELPKLKEKEKEDAL